LRGNSLGRKKVSIGLLTVKVAKITVGGLRLEA